MTTELKLNKQVIENGLNLFLKVTKHQITESGIGNKFLRVDLKHTRTAKNKRVLMSIVAERIFNNLNNERETGCCLSKNDANALGFDTEKDTNVFYVTVDLKGKRSLVHFS